MGKLMTKGINNIKTTGKHFDGNGLYLLVKASGSRLWQGKYRFAGKEKTASYGVYPETSLKEARDLHAAFRLQVKQGIDPLAQKQQAKTEKKTAIQAHFETLARDWYQTTANAKQWGDKHRKKVSGLLERHVIPAFCDRDARTITPKEITEFIQRLDQQGINATAHECFDLVRRIFAYAVQIELRETSPAAHLKDIIPNTPSTPMKHATDPARIGEILLILERAQVMQMATKAMVMLAPMLFTRPSELRQMCWDEIDGDTWTIPAERMKKRRPLVVPLLHQAMAIIEGMRVFTGKHPHVLANTTTGKPISEGAAQRLKIRHSLHDEITWHGWRHTASTLLNERGYNRDHVEAQFAHADSNSIRGTYNHAQYLEQRREMLQAWADYLQSLKEKAQSGEK